MRKFNILKKAIALTAKSLNAKEKRSVMFGFIPRFLLLLPTVKASMHDVACLYKKRQSISEINHLNILQTIRSEKRCQK